MDILKKIRNDRFEATMATGFRNDGSPYWVISVITFSLDGEPLEFEQMIRETHDGALEGWQAVSARHDLLGA